MCNRHVFHREVTQFDGGSGRKGGKGWYAEALYRDEGATLDDLREAVMTLEDAGRIARRVFGGEHPLRTGIDVSLRNSRVALRAREAPPTTA